MTIKLAGTTGVTFPDLGNYQNAAGSIVGSGYQKLPNGLFLQWGTLSNIPANSTDTVTLPIAFPNTCFMAVATAFGTNTSTSEFALQCANLSTTTFTIANPNGATRSAYWIAFGN